MRLTVAIIVIVVVVALGGLLVLATAPISPSTQKVEQVVPDDRLPR